MNTNRTTEKRWWLYCQDLKFARYKQWDLALKVKQREQANELAIMTYLGEYAECEKQIIKLNLSEYKQGRDALLRARRALGKRNTWESLISKDIQIEPTIKQIDKAIKNGETICVNLVGGIGDQIESSSLLIGETEQYSPRKGPIIQIKAEGDNKEAVTEYLLRTNAKKMISGEQSYTNLNLSYPLYRYWRERSTNLPLVYKKLCDIKKKTKIKSGELNILVCWRCKMNKKNLISSFSRSVPFKTIMEFMQLIEKKIGIQRVNIIDITKYNGVEKKIISTNYPKIRLAGDTVNSIEYLIELISLSEMIISVDTSLVHVSATCNRQVNALLPKYADERWLELMKSEGVYKQNVIIHKQEKFHNWESCSKSILNNIIRNLENQITYTKQTKLENKLAFHFPNNNDVI